MLPAQPTLGAGEEHWCLSFKSLDANSCLSVKMIHQGREGAKMAEWKDPELTVSHTHKITTNHRTTIDEKTETYRKRSPTAKDIKEKLQ